jgi:hypothetical protein
MTTTLTTTRADESSERHVTIPTPSVRKRHANDFMRAGLAHFEAAAAIPFFCECDRDGCFQAVWLTKASYDRSRVAPAWRALADAHDADMPLGRTGRARAG